MSTLKNKLISNGKPAFPMDFGRRSRAYYEAEARKVEVPMTEQLLPRGHFIDRFSYEKQETIWKKGLRERAGVGRKRKKLLYEGMRRLSEEYRRCIVAIYWDDLSLQKTAQKLGISKSTVIRRKDAAIEELKEYIESEEK